MVCDGNSSGGRLAAALLAGLLAAAWPAAADPGEHTVPSVLERRLDGPYRFSGSPETHPVFVETGGGRAVDALIAGGLPLARLPYGPERAAGSGAAVSALRLFQSAFIESECAAACEGSPCCGGAPCCDGPCNVVTLLWDQSPLKSSPIEVYADGRFLDVVTPPPGLEPGRSGVHISGVPAGVHAFKIVSPDNGTSESGVIEVLDAQPFSDPTTLECFAGAVTGDSCELEVFIENRGPLPSYYGVFVDDSLPYDVPGHERSLVIPGLPPGEHCVTVQGLLQTDDGVYLGCRKTVCCELDCEEPPCAPPFRVRLCQVGYGGEDGEHLFQASWVNGEEYEVGVRIFRDGEQVGMVPAEYTRAVYPARPGEHTFGFEGDCGADGVSARVEKSIAGLAQTPHPNPVAGDVVCEWSDEEGGTTTASWTNAAPSEFIDVYVVSHGELYLVGTTSGAAVGVSVGPTDPEDVIALQFFVHADGACRGSELITCGRSWGPRYIPAVCNGSAALDISSAMAILNFLFLGTEDPPCRAACDCNGDRALNIADASCVFGFLFLGSRTPNRWAGGGCVPVDSGDDCAVPNAVCDE